MPQVPNAIFRRFPSFADAAAATDAEVSRAAGTARGSAWLWAVGAALSVCGASLIGDAMPPFGPTLSTIWLASGAALTAWLLAPGARQQGFVLVGSAVGCTLARIVDDEAGLAIARGLTVAIELIVAGTILRRRLAGRTIDFGGLAAVLILTAAAMIACAVGAAFYVIVGEWVIGRPGLLATWRAMFAADALGMLTVTPAVISLWRDRHDRVTWRHLESAVALGLITLTATVALGGRSDVPMLTTFPFLSVLPILIWTSVRLKTWNSALACLIVAVVAAHATAEGNARLAPAEWPVIQRVETLQSALLVWTLCGLTLTVITEERRRTGLALRRQQEFAAAVLDNVADGIVACDAQGRLSLFNQASRAMHQTNAEPVSPETWAERYELFAADGLTPLAMADVPLYRAFRGEIVRDMELVIVPRNGAWLRRLVCSGRAFHDNDGNLLGAVVGMTDVTERRRVEDEMRQAKEVAERYAAQAEAGARSKTAFLANMSHEIRTPLTAILGFADLLADRGLPDAVRADHIDTIRRNGNHLLSLINDVLDLSKVEAGRLDMERVPFAPATVAAEVEALMRVRASERKLAFSVEFDGAVPRQILGDAVRLRQVLLNLVSNAIKFTERGSVRLVVAATDVHGGPYVAQAGGRARLRFEVHDTGIGIAPEQLQSLFQPFAQADGSMTRRFGGSGLGLAISRRLVEMMRGTLDVYSEPGRGSVFEFTVECDAISAASALPEQDDVTVGAPIAHALAGRVLLAEDGEDNRLLIEAVLESAGLRVESACNGRVAVEMAERARHEGRPYDLVLMDMQMPVLDGYRAADELRRLGHADLPIVALTAHVMNGERERCLRAGCDDYATKPLDRLALFATIRRQLARRPKGAVAATVAEDAPSPTVPRSRTDRSPLRSSRANDAVVRRILPDYVASLAEHAVRLDGAAAALEAGGPPIASRDATWTLVHQLRGSGGGYGFPLITEVATSVELAIASRAPADAVASLLHSLADVLRRVEIADDARAAA